MTEPRNKPPFRLAFRKEGEFVHAYLAAIDSMEGATLMATMRVSVLNATPGLFDEFRVLLQKTVEYGMREAGLEFDSSYWTSLPAPPYENTGDA